MTVRELITKLLDHPLDLEVRIMVSSTDTDREIRWVTLVGEASDPNRYVEIDGL